MGVSVTAVANARLRSEFQQSALDISPADVARGYVDSAAATRFSVVTNSRAGYVLDLRPVTRIFESVRIGGLGTPVALGARAPLPADRIHELSYRFILRAEAGAGSYPWPLQRAVRPLD
jgi:hypothetical protein